MPGRKLTGGFDEKFGKEVKESVKETLVENLKEGIKEGIKEVSKEKFTVVVGDTEVDVTDQVQDKVSKKLKSKLDGTEVEPEVTVVPKVNVKMDKSSEQEVGKKAQAFVKGAMPDKVETTISVEKQSYDRAVGLLKEVIELQERIKKADYSIIPHDSQPASYIYSGDVHKNGKVTKASVKSKLNNYLTTNNDSDFVALAAYVNGLHDMEAAEKIFGKKHSDIFKQIVTYIDDAKDSLEAYGTANIKMSAAVSNLKEAGANFQTYGDLWGFEDVVKDGGLDAALNYLKEKLGFEIPEASEKASEAAKENAEAQEKDTRAIESNNKAKDESQAETKETTSAIEEETAAHKANADAIKEENAARRNSVTESPEHGYLRRESGAEDSPHSYTEKINDFINKQVTPVKDKEGNLSYISKYLFDYDKALNTITSLDDKIIRQIHDIKNATEEEAAPMLTNLHLLESQRKEAEDWVKEMVDSPDAEVNQSQLDTLTKVRESKREQLQAELRIKDAKAETVRLEKEEVQAAKEKANVENNKRQAIADSVVRENLDYQYELNKAQAEGEKQKQQWLAEEKERQSIVDQYHKENLYYEKERQRIIDEGIKKEKERADAERQKIVDSLRAEDLEYYDKLDRALEEGKQQAEEYADSIEAINKAKAKEYENIFYNGAGKLKEVEFAPNTEALRNSNALYDELESKLKRVYDLQETSLKADKETFVGLEVIAKNNQEILDLKKRMSDIIQEISAAEATQAAREEELLKIDEKRDNVLKDIKKYQELQSRDDMASSVSKWLEKLEKLQFIGKYTSTFNAELDNTINELKHFDVSSGSIDNVTAAFEKLKEKVKEIDLGKQLAKNKKAAEASISKLNLQIEEFTKKNSKMGAEFRKQFEALKIDFDAEQSIEGISRLVAEFNKLKYSVAEAEKTGKGFFDTLRERITGVNAQFLAQYFSWQDWIRYTREAFEAIKELDYALVDLKKTTQMSSDELEVFYKDSNDIAKKMGVTTKAIIEQAASWSRLGYGTAEASRTMAELSSQFASISPGMSTEDAQTGLVSLMKAYDVATDEVERKLMDNINVLGNKFAETNNDIIEGMKRAGATLSAIGTSVEDSFALFTGAQEIIQNAETVGTALKTLSLRIRGFDEETEEMSDDVIAAVGKVASLTKVASNSYAGVSLWADAAQTQYRSLKDYLGDIAAIWDEIDAKSQTDLLNNLFGKRGASVGASILQNFGQVEKAIEEMEKAEGAADEEMKIIEESIDYKLNALKETWVGILQDLIDRGIIGQLIDGLTAISEALGTIIKHAGLFGTVGIVAVLQDWIKNIDRLRKRFKEYYDFILGIKDSAKFVSDSFKTASESIRTFSETAQGIDTIADAIDTAEKSVHTFSDTLETLSNIRKLSETTELPWWSNLDDLLEVSFENIPEINDEVVEEVSKSWADTLADIADSDTWDNWGDSVEKTWAETLEEIADSDSWDRWGDAAEEVAEEVGKSWSDTLAEIASSDTWDNWGDEVEESWSDVLSHIAESADDFNWGDVTEEVTSSFIETAETAEETFGSISDVLSDSELEFLNFGSASDIATAALTDNELAFLAMGSSADIAAGELGVADAAMVSTSVAADGAAASVTTLSAALKGFVVAHPAIAFFVVLAAAVAGSVAAFDAATTSVEEYREKISGIEEDISSLKSEIDKLQNIDFRTAEEQERLDLLKSQLEYQERLLEVEQQRADIQKYGFTGLGQSFDGENANNILTDDKHNRGYTTVSINKTPTVMGYDAGALTKATTQIKDYDEQLKGLSEDSEEYSKVLEKRKDTEESVANSLERIYADTADYMNKYEQAQAALESGNLVIGSDAYKNAVYIRDMYKTWINENEEAIESYEKAIGTFDYSSIIESTLSKVDFEGIQDRLVDLTQNGKLTKETLESIGDTTIQKLLSQLHEAGVETEVFYQWLLRISGIVDTQNLAEKVAKKLGKKSYDERGFEVDPTQKIRDWYDDYLETEEERQLVAGLNIDLSTFDADDYLKKAQQAVDDSRNSPLTVEVEFNQSTFSEQVNELDALQSLYQTFVNNVQNKETKINLDISDVEALREKFGELEDFDEFELVVTSDTSGADDIQKAFDTILTQYANQKIALEGVDEQNKEMIRTQLEMEGATEESAKKLVEHAYDLERANKLAAESGIDLANATDAEVQEFINEGKALGIDVVALSEYIILHGQANGGIWNLDLQALIDEYEQLGLNCDQLREYLGLKNQYGSSGNYVGQFNSPEDWQRYQDSMHAAEEEIKNNAKNRPVKYDYGDFINDAKNAGSAAGDAYVEAFEKELEALEAQRDAGIIGETEFLEKYRDLIEKYFKDVDGYGDEYSKRMADYWDRAISHMENVVSAIGKLLDKKISAAEEGKEAAISALEDEKEAAHEAYQAQIDAIQEQIDAIDDHIDALDKEIDKINEQINVYQKQIDAINEANTAREHAMALEKAQYELQRSLNQRTKLIYTGEVGQMRYERDESAVRSAQESVNDAEDQLAIDAIQKQIDLLEEEIELIEKQKDALKEQQEELKKQQEAIQKMMEESDKYYDKLIKQQEEYWDKLIKSLEKQKSKWEELIEQKEIAEAFALIQETMRELGYTVDDVLNDTPGAFEAFRDAYLNALVESKNGNEDFIEGLSRATGQAKEKFGELASAAEGISDSTEPLADSAENVKKFGDAASTAAEGVGKLKDAVSGISTDGVCPAECIDKLNNANFDGLSSSIESLKSNLEAISKLIAGEDGSIESALQALNDPEILSELGNAFENLYQSVVNVATALGVDAGGSGGEGESDSANSKSRSMSEGSSEGEGTGLIQALEAVKTAADTFIGMSPDEEGETTIGRFNLLKKAVDAVSQVIGTGEDEGGEGEGETTLIGAINDLYVKTNEALYGGGEGGNGAINAFNELAEAIAACAAAASELLGSITAIGQVDFSGFAALLEGGGGGFKPSMLGKPQHAYTGTAKYDGDWRVGKNEKSLVGELGPEAILRDGKYTIVGKDGPEFVQLRADDIVLNHKQTAAILDKKNQVRALADGSILTPLSSAALNIQGRIQQGFRNAIPDLEGIQKIMQQQTRDLSAVIQKNNTPNITITNPQFTVTGVNGEQVMRQIEGAFEGLMLNAYQKAMS